MAPRPTPTRTRDALLPLGTLALAAALFVAVLILWAAAARGTLAGLDAGILRALRVPGHPGLPAGPHWLEQLLRDATVLGGGRMLTLLVIGAAGLFIVRRQAGTALILIAASQSGSLLVSLAKGLAGRARPEIVPRLVIEQSASFPSAHAANSAIVFLTVAVLAVRVEEDRATRRYTIGLGVAMTLLIGVSRLYLGVHWPTDVLAGWCFGAGWAALWYVAAQRLLPRG